MHASSHRLTQLLQVADPSTLAPIYATHDMAPSLGVPALVREIQRDGGSTIVNFWRDDGVPYAEVVADVARFFDVDPKQYPNEIELEQAVLDAAWTAYRKNASPEELQAIDESMAEACGKVRWEGQVRGGARVASGVALSVLLKLFGRQIFMAILQKVILPRLGWMVAARVAWFAARGGLGMVIPVVNVLFGAWAVYDLDGPALRKTSQTVLAIAALRAAQDEPFYAAA